MPNCHGEPFDKLRTSLSNHDAKTRIYATLREAQGDKKRLYKQTLFNKNKLHYSDNIAYFVILQLPVHLRNDWNFQKLARVQDLYFFEAASLFYLLVFYCEIIPFFFFRFYKRLTALPNKPPSDIISYFACSLSIVLYFALSSSTILFA